MLSWRFRPKAERMRLAGNEHRAVEGVAVVVVVDVAVLGRETAIRRTPAAKRMAMAIQALMSQVTARRMALM
jgi:hypothetical protein